MLPVTMHRKTSLPLCLFFIAPLKWAASDTQTKSAACPQGDITLAGSTTALRQIEAWKEAYQEICPKVDFDFQGGGHAMGAARVCDSHPVYAGVDMAAMPNGFFAPQASTIDGWNYDCHRSERKTIMLHVGHSGIRVDTAAGGSAAACIELMGGLTVDQLRWIYSDFTMRELEGFKWNRNAVPFSDGDDSTHLWSELHQNCTDEEIIPVGPADEKGIAYTFLFDHVLTGGFETARDYYKVENVGEIDEYLESHPNAIAFLQFYNVLSPKFVGRVNKTYPVPIMDRNGDYIKPSTETFETHEYPLLRRVDLALHNDPESLAKVRPFIEFGLSPKGDQVTEDAGFWPIRIWEKITMHSRIGSSAGFNIEEVRKWCGPSGGEIRIAGSSDVKDIALVWSQLYNLACPTSVTLEAGSSGTGATRLCASDIEVALMSRDWTDEESGELRNGFLHKCQSSIAQISSVQVDVAKDGLTVVVAKDGAADRCIRILGGLTKHQLRWIYSNYSEEQLTASGWDPTSLQMSDGTAKTHLWRELDARCEPEEIRLSGDLLGGDAFTTFSKAILPRFGDGEHVSQNRTTAYVGEFHLELLVYLLKNKGSVSFVPFHYYVENQELFVAVPIQNEHGTFILPSEESITDESYPIVRRLTMNLINRGSSLARTIPLLKFGYNHPRVLANTGYVPLHGDELKAMLERLDGAPYVVREWEEVAESGKSVEVNSWSFIFSICGAFVAFLIISCVLYWFTIAQTKQH